jgi:hypothetical protein
LQKHFFLLAAAVSFTVLFAADAPGVDDSNAILQKIRDKVAEHLSRLPNYTCHEKVSRLIRPMNSSGAGLHDQVVLEVAFVGRQELFARQGESTFQEPSISKVVPYGTIGSGAFAAHIDSIFSGDAASFDYAGAAKKDGHKTVRYDFQVPLEKSRFVVKHNSVQGIVAYQGSFWADLDSLELVRLEIKADHIPPLIGVRIVKEVLRYSPVHIRDSDVLLPLHSELEVSDSAGTFSINDVSLEQCREYTGESTITFGAPIDKPSPTPEP